MRPKVFDGRICVNLQNEKKEKAMEYLKEIGSDLSTEIRKLVYELAEKQRNK